MMVDGNPSKVRCLNLVGLKRNGLSSEAIESLHEAHRLLYRSHMTTEHASEVLKAHDHYCAEVRSLLDFIESQHGGKHGRAGIAGGRDDAAARRSRGRRPPGPAPRADSRQCRALS